LNHKFAVFYVTVISVALVGSLYANYLNPAWNRVVFTFPPEAQEVVENGTAIMEVKWRWFLETLEMIVKVNDDDFNETRTRFNHSDWVGLLFDSDHNGELTTGAPITWQESADDHGVFIGGGGVSAVYAKCYIHSTWGYNNNSVSPRRLLCWDFHPDFIAYLNNSYCIYREGEGYTFKLSIPRELINVETPTPIHVSFSDDYVVMKEAYIRNKTYQDTVAADFTG
jgi:hypothetical protein